MEADQHSAIKEILTENGPLLYIQIWVFLRTTFVWTEIWRYGFQLAPTKVSSMSIISLLLSITTISYSIGKYRYNLIHSLTIDKLLNLLNKQETKEKDFQIEERAISNK